MAQVMTDEEFLAAHPRAAMTDEEFLAARPSPQQGGAGSATAALGKAASGIGSAMAQLPYGFNERLGQIIGAGARIDPLRPVYEATGIPQPARELAEWLVGEQMAPPAANVPERVMRSGGAMLAETALPAAAMQSLAARVAEPVVRSIGGLTPMRVARPETATAERVLAPTTTRLAQPQATTLAERAGQQLLEAYRQAPAAVSAGEAMSATGAGVGGQVGEEIAPGSAGARITGELVGGLAGPAAALPVVRAGARGIGAITRQLGGEAQARRAREYVGRELGDHLESEQASAGLKRAEEIAEAAPGFEPSLAQRTRIPALAETQRAIERGASGSELDTMVARHQRNVEALQQFGRSSAPAGEGGADAALEPLVQGRQAAAGRVRELEQQKAALAARRAPGEIQAQREAIADREREALRALQERTTGQRQDIAAGIERIDRGAVGERLRGKVQDRRAEAMERMSALSSELGLDDADVTVPFQRFQESMTRWQEGLLPSQRENLPASLRDIDAVAARAENGITFRDIKALREAITDEWLEAVRDTSPGHRKRLANVLKLRNMVDNELLGENLELAQPGLAEAYRQFRGRYLNEVIKPFERGAVKEVRRSDGTGFYRTLDEDVAAKALESQDAARQFRQVLGDDPEAMADLTSVALDDLANAAVRGGVVQPRALETWLVKRRSALEELPQVRETVQRIAKAVSDVEAAHKATEGAIKQRGLEARRGLEQQRRAVEQAEANLDQAMRPLLERMGTLNERQMALEDTMLARRLAGIERGTQRPEQVIDEAVRNPRLMMKLWSDLSGQDQAKAALRRHLWDGLTTLDGASLNRFLDQHDPSLKIAFGADHLKRLRMIADGLEMLEAVPAPTTARPISPDPAERLKQITGADPSSLAARYLAVRRGRSSRWVEGFAGFMNWLRQRGKMASDELMKRALYDPSVAQALVDSVNLRKFAAPKSRLRAWMFTMGAAAPVRELQGAIGASEQPERMGN